MPLTKEQQALLDSIPDAGQAIEETTDWRSLLEALPDAAEEGVGGVPGSMTAPGTTPSFFDKLFGAVGRGFEISGEAAMVRGQAEALAGQEAIRMALRAGDIIDRPYNAIRVGFHRALANPRTFEKTANMPSFLIPSRKDIGFAKESAGIFVDNLTRFKDGMADGITRRETREISEVFDEAIFGPGAEEKLSNFMDNKPVLKFSKSAVDLYTNIATEILVDTAIAVGALRTIKPVTRKITAEIPIAARGLARISPKAYVSIHWDDMKLPNDTFIKRGFSEWVDETAKLNTTALGREIRKPAMDELILNHIMRDVPPGTTRMIAVKPGDKAIVVSKVRDIARLHQFDEDLAQTAINELNRRRIKAIKDFGDIEHRIKTRIDPRIAGLDGSLTIQESLPMPTITRQKMEELSKRLDSAYMTKEFLQTQKDELSKVVNVIDGRIRTIGQGLPADPLGIQTARIVRTKYLDEYRKVRSGEPFINNEIERVINTVSNGRTKAVEELRDDEFFAMFEFLDIAIKDPENFTRLPKRFQPVPPGGNWATPAWTWFYRRGAENIWHQVDQADILSTKFKQEAMQKWEEALDTIGVGAAKDEDLQRRLFWYANNGTIQGRDRAAYFDEVKRLGLPEESIAKEVNAAESFKEVMDDLGEQAIAQNKLTRDGTGAPRRLDDYVYHQFDDIVKEAGPNEEFALRELARPFEFRTNTKIDIPQFKRRIANKDEGLIENLDTAFRAALGSESWALHFEPAIKRADLMAQLSGNPEIIGYTRDWINYAVRGMPTKTELRTEKYFDWFGRNILEKGTKWLPERYRFATKERATKQMLSGIRRAHLFGGISYNIGSMARNSVQGLQGTTFVGVRHSKWAIESLFTDGGKELLENCTVRLGRMPLQTFEVNRLSHIERFGMRGFKWVDQWPNVSKTFNESLHWSIIRDKKKIEIVRKFGYFQPWTDIKRSSKTLSRAINAGRFAKDVEIANYLARTAQYSYRNFDMPRYLWGQWGKTLGQFTSWPANYYYSFLPEAAKWSLTGRGPGGVILGAWERQALARHYMYNTGVFLAGKAIGLDLSKHLPPGPRATFPFVGPGGAMPYETTLLGPSPLAQSFKGAVQWGMGLKNQDARQAAEGRSEFMRSFTFLPPIGFRNILQVAEGEKEPLELLFRKIKEEPTKFGRGFRIPSPPRRPSF